MKKEERVSLTSGELQDLLAEVQVDLLADPRLDRMQMFAIASIISLIGIKMRQKMFEED